MSCPLLMLRAALDPGCPRPVWKSTSESGAIGDDATVLAKSENGEKGTTTPSSEEIVKRRRGVEASWNLIFAQVQPSASTSSFSASAFNKPSPSFVARLIRVTTCISTSSPVSSDCSVAARGARARLASSACAFRYAMTLSNVRRSPDGRSMPEPGSRTPWHEHLETDRRGLSGLSWPCASRNKLLKRPRPLLPLTLAFQSMPV